MEFLFFPFQIFDFGVEIRGTRCYNGIISDHGSDFFSEFFDYALAVDVGFFILFEFFEFMNELVDFFVVFEFLADGLLLCVAFLNVLDVELEGSYG